MASNTKSSNTAVLLRLKQYKMENPVEQSCSTEQKPMLETKLSEEQQKALEKALDQQLWNAETITVTRLTKGSK